MGGRVDLNRYFSSAELIRNYRTTPQGAAVRRDGTQFIQAGKFPSKKVRLETFEFSVEQAYTLEIGEKYIRFYVGLNPLEDSPGVPHEVVTPYLESELFDVQIIQSADVAFFTHPLHPPQELQRTSATTFAFFPRILLHNPCTQGVTVLDATLTVSAVSGFDVLATLSDVVGDALFLDGDVDRPIASGQGGGIIKELVGTAPTNQARVTVLAPFASVGPFVSGTWSLRLTPTVSLVFDKAGPRGAETNIQAEQIVVTAAEEISNGDFAFGGTDWVDLSAPLVVTGTHTGPASGNELEDSTTNFVAAGAEVGHDVLNITDSTFARADSFSTSTNPDDTIGLNPPLSGGSFNAGETYEVRQTGSVSFATGSARVLAEENGIGHFEQEVVGIVPNSRYRLQFDVSETSIVLRVGSISGGDDILQKTTFSTGVAQVITFTSGSGTSLFLGFANSQSTTTSVIDNVSMKRSSAKAFRAADVGAHIATANGSLLIIEVVDAENIVALFFAPLDVESIFVSLELTGSLETFVIAVGFWSLLVSAFSVERGFPRTQSFHDNRFWYFGTKANPLTAWGSVSGVFDDFARGADDDRGIEVTISANQMNTLEWAEPFRDLLVGTRGGEHMLTGGNDPITPSNIAQIPQGTAGSPPFRPLRLGSLLFHLQRGRRHIHELTIDPDVTQLSQTRDLIILNPGITRSGITQWAMQQQPDNTIWATREDGVMVGLTIETVEQVRGWHRHTMPGATIESVTRIPRDDALTEATEQVWLAVKRSVEGADVRHIEVMIPKEEDDTQQRAELTVDSALRYNGAPATTFSGLEHLEGLTVRLVQRDDTQVVLPTGETVQTDKLTDLGEQVVVEGQVTTDAPVSKLDVGLFYPAKIVTLRPEIPQEDGTLQGRRLRWIRLSARLIGTLGLELNGHVVPFRSVSDLMGLGLLPQNRDVFTDGSNWTDDGRITVEQTRALPSTVLSLVGDIEAEEVG